MFWVFVGFFFGRRLFCHASFEGRPALVCKAWLVHAQCVSVQVGKRLQDPCINLPHLVDIRG